MFTLPEQEDVERHSDRIPLSADPDGLQDARVSQLAADQVVLKNAWLLKLGCKDVKKSDFTAGHSETVVMFVETHNV